MPSRGEAAEYPFDLQLSQEVLSSGGPPALPVSALTLQPGRL